MCSFIIVLVALLRFVQPIQIHHHMTKEEVLHTFQTTHTDVPEHEVVSVFHKLHKRDTGNDEEVAVKVNAFNREISLYLNPTEGLLAGYHTPVWTVTSDPRSPEKTRYTPVENAFENIGQTYQDPSKLAAIVAYKGERGETLITGSLLPDVVIRPLPQRINDTVFREARSLKDSLLNFNTEEEGFRRSEQLHVVFKRQEPVMDSMHSSIKLVKRDRKNSENTTNERLKRSIPNIIYPEILVIVDYNLYSVLGKNVEEATRYVCAFWNAVDLRYRLLENPEIRLNIAGIIISLELDGTPYLENNRRGSIEVDADLAIEDMSHYFYRQAYIFPFSMYDMAIAMTRLDMCNIEYNDVCNPSTLGYAYEWGACNRSDIEMNTEAVGIIEDNGGYGAIIPAAHEVAHLMGAPHDGLEEGFDCPSWEGFIMSSSLNFLENSFQWSNCSLKYLHKFISSPDASCVFDEPKPDKAVPLMLPGKLLSLDEQCQKVIGTKACYYDESVCTNLQCRLPKSKFCRTVSAAAEGSYCGDGMHCINGHCVEKNASLVPVSISTTLPPYQPNFDEPNFVFQFRAYSAVSKEHSGET